MVVHKYVTLSWRCCVEFMAGVRHVKKSMTWWIQCKYSGLVISSPKCPWSVGVQCKWTPVQIKSINSLLRISSSFRIPKFANSKISEFANVQMQMTSLAWLGKPSYPNLTPLHGNAPKNPISCKELLLPMKFLSCSPNTCAYVSSTSQIHGPGVMDSIAKNMINITMHSIGKNMMNITMRMEMIQIDQATRSCGFNKPSILTIESWWESTRKLTKLWPTASGYYTRKLPKITISALPISSRKNQYNFIWKCNQKPQILQLLMLL